ncbi:hypothetical protein JK628_18325 [Shewanella sp. KX20019]|uniref:hypothetical protein n=1 Tax=Shewanella sp. KX20019 TaxID=2803864 RepID=UPI0019284F40|nr:hypothetical protein [Shewanella sp. KX20019]QQX79464.1 hypothetical protein JK628_18325 [Shewanella sp. KX20019]
MMITGFVAGLAFTAGYLWDDIGAKRALICDRETIELCLAQLPPMAREQLPNSQLLQLSMGARAAMVLPILHPKIAGVLMTDFDKLPKKRSVNWGVGYYSLKLNRQDELTYWHELGHLEAIAAMESLNQQIRSMFQHEWLSDLYLIWRVAKDTDSLSLAWQQYHRRNIDVMANIEFMSHWSVPIMLQALQHYSVKELQAFDSFNAFLTDFWPQLTVPSNDNIAEFSSLIQRTFGAGTVQPLSGYMYWRKPALGVYLEPTLIKLMGHSGAKRWLAEQSMQPETLRLTPRL